MIKEITVFTNGDANDIRTWSNVPYFFTKNIEKKGVKVNNVNIAENKFFDTFFRNTVYSILKILYKKTDYTYFRSRINHFLISKKIHNAINKYPQSDVFLFLTYSFSFEKKIDKKVVLFGDWTYLYKITKLDNRTPYWFEQYPLKIEKQNINNADIVLSLFPKSKDFIEENYHNKNTYYLGNVINSSFPLNKDLLIQAKLKSNKILFIGNKKYIQGALDAIEACTEYNKTNHNPIELHIIGLNEEDVFKTNNITCYGYLNKGIETEYQLYYKLVTEARVVINTTKNWGGFSAMTEAMYYYTPVITTPYEEFTETYGEVIDCGYYTRLNTTDELVTTLKSIMNEVDANYITLMENAHNKVKDFSWSSYIDKFLNKLA